MADQGQTKQENDAPPDSRALLSLCWASIFGLGLVLLFVVLVLMLIAIWPTVQSNPSNFLGRAWAPDVSLFGWLIIPELTSEIRLILIVVAAAGLGSFLHAASSFADYLGNRRYGGSTCACRSASVSRCCSTC